MLKELCFLNTHEDLDLVLNIFEDCSPSHLQPAHIHLSLKSPTRISGLILDLLPSCVNYLYV